MDNYDAFTVGETVMVDIPMARDLCDEARGELDMVFAFEHMECDQIGVKWFKTRFKPKRLMKILTRWQTGLEWNTCYLENHDQPRSVTRFVPGGKYRKAGAKMLLGLIFSLRGTPFVYQGEEIGMTNGAFNSLDEIMDIESHNVDKMARSLGIINPFRWKLIRKTSRDNARTPMQWTGVEGAGFTSGKPWLKINPNFAEVNVERDLSDEDGVIDFFKKINTFKKNSETLTDGDFAEIYSGRSVYAFKRSTPDESFIALFNFSKHSKRMPRGILGECVLSNYVGVPPLRLRPYEYRLIKVKGEVKK